MSLEGFKKKSWYGLICILKVSLWLLGEIISGSTEGSKRETSWDPQGINSDETREVTVEIMKMAAFTTYFEAKATELGSRRDMVFEGVREPLREFGLVKCT